MKALKNKIIEEYLISNAAKVADTMCEIDSEDMELIIMFSIFRKREKQLTTLLNAALEIKSCKLDISSDSSMWSATVYFDKDKYEKTYGNTHASAMSIEALAAELIKDIKSK